MGLFGKAESLGNRRLSHAAMRGAAAAPASVAGMPSRSAIAPTTTPTLPTPYAKPIIKLAIKLTCPGNISWDITRLMGPDIIKKNPPNIRKTIRDGPLVPRKRPSRI